MIILSATESDGGNVTSLLVVSSFTGQFAANSVISKGT